MARPPACDGEGDATPDKEKEDVMTLTRFSLRCSHDGDNDFLSEDDPDGSYCYAEDAMKELAEREMVLKALQRDYDRLLEENEAALDKLVAEAEGTI